MVSAQYGRLFVTNFVRFVFPNLKPTCKLKTIQSYVLELGLLLEIITLVSSANNIGSAREFILNGRSFI